MIHTKNELISTITESQHCQRNWDLSKTIPKEDLDIFIHTVKEAPTKQNRIFYKVKFITDRDLIQKMYDTTNSFWNRDKGELITNAQTYANLLVIFIRDKDHNRNHRTLEEYIGENEEGNFPVDPIDESKAVGVCAGYLNLVARMMGYQTGFYDSRHRQEEFNEIVGGQVLQSLGIGYKNPDKVWNQHHIENYKYDLYTKDVEVEVI